jgi:hypothetical protein
MKKFETLNYTMDVGETQKFQQIKDALGLKHNSEVFRVILKAYEVED